MPPKKPEFGAKTAFILARPGKSSREIIAEAKAAGMTFEPIYVRTVRLRARKAAASPPRRRGRLPKHLTSMRITRLPAGEGMSSLERRFAEVALELGLARAESVLRRLRERVERIFV